MSRRELIYGLRRGVFGRQALVRGRADEAAQLRDERSALTRGGLLLSVTPAPADRGGEWAHRRLSPEPALTIVGHHLHGRLGLSGLLGGPSPCALPAEVSQPLAL